MGVGWGSRVTGGGEYVWGYENLPWEDVGDIQLPPGNMMVGEGGVWSGWGLPSQCFFFLSNLWRARFTSPSRNCVLYCV